MNDPRVTTESLEAWTNRDLDYEEDLNKAIVKAILDAPDTMAHVAARIEKPYHDVERRFAPLIRHRVLEKGKPGDTKPNPSGHQARIIYPSHHAEDFLDGRVELHDLTPMRTRADYRAKALVQAKKLTTIRDVRDGYVQVPIDEMVALSVALDRMEES